MNKKFLSAILCGAMLVTAIGTFVSCKDYDDDIEDLQSQIDGLTTSSSSLSSSLSSVQSSLESQLSSTQSTLQSQITSAQNTLQSAIDAKADASEISSLAGDVVQLKEDYEAATSALTTQIEAAQNAIDTLQTSAGSKETEEALQNAIDAANATLAALTGAASTDEQTIAGAAENLRIQLDALINFQTTVESADFQSQIDALNQLINGDESDGTTSLTQRIDSVKIELQAAIDANITDIDSLKETMKYISDKMDEINPNLDAITLLVERGVTGIELVYSYAKQQGDTNSDDDNELTLGTDLVFTNGIEEANVFGKGLKNEMEFVAGRLYKKQASFLVRVSPINADLSEANLRFVNSKGETLDDIITITKVATYNTLLTKAVNTGLWEITVEVADDLTKAAFFGATNTKSDGTGNQVLFAVQANNTSADYADRYVTSSYDLTMDWQEYTPADALYFDVDDWSIEDVANRYAGQVGKAFLDDPATAITRDELCWKASTTNYPTPAVSGNSNNTTIDGNDDRTTSELYPAVVGQTITVSLKEMNSSSAYVKAEHIKALYVTLDYQDFAVESLPSEWVAWNSYDISGLNEVVEGTSIDITVNDQSADGDIIGFRVFAVNYDGTLVDPDGKSFYIGIGEAGKNWNATNTTIVPEYETIYTTTSDSIAVSLTDLTSPTTYTWTTTPSISGGTNPCFNIVMLNSDNTVAAYTSNGSLTTTSNFSSFSKVTKIYTTIANDPNNPTAALNDWTAYTDGSAYTGKLVIENANGRTLATLNVTMTKELPTGLPTNFSIKTGQVTNGIYYAYLVPDNWTAGQATTGTMVMDEIFNFGTTDQDILSNYFVTFATSAKDSNGNYTVSQTLDGTGDSNTSTTGNGTLTVDAELVDNSTRHATTAGYNYGKISSVKNSSGTYDDYKVTAETFQSIYISIYAEDAFTWNWATLAQAGEVDNTTYTTLPYSTELTYGNSGQYIETKYIIGISKKDSEYDAKGLDDPYEGSLEFVDASLVSTSNGLPEYFTVTATTATGTNGNTVATKLTFDPSPSSTTNPMEVVPSQLILNYIDSYGDPVVIKLDMTVKQRLD